MIVINAVICSNGCKLDFGHLIHCTHGNHVLHMVITSRQTAGVTELLGFLFCYYILHCIIAYYYIPEGSSLIS